MYMILLEAGTLIKTLWCFQMLIFLLRFNKNVYKTNFLNKYILHNILIIMGTICT